MRKWLFLFALLLGLTGFAQPVITSVSPNSGPIGTLVTITGTQLNNPTGISIGGVNAIPISSSTNTIVAMVMPGATTGLVNVTTANGNTNYANNFSVTLTQVPNRQQGNKLVGTGSFGSSLQGRSVAISADGNTAAIGAPFDSNSTGAVWIFVRNNGNWVQQGEKLIGTGSIGKSSQGMSVGISADGNTIIVGGDKDNDGVGAAWIFTRSNGSWLQQGSKLVGSGATEYAYQGTSVAISADGNTAVIGAAYDDYSIGSIWVFARNNGNWEQQGTKLVGTGTVNSAQQGSFLQ